MLAASLLSWAGATGTNAAFGGDGSQGAEEILRKIVVIPVQGDIDRALVVFLRRGIDRALSEGAGLIVFDINTFGGRVDSALQIATLIGSIRGAQTAAFISTSPEGLGVSWSAGALISFACSRLFMAPGTSIGAAAPVYLTQEGTKAAEEKTVSAVRTQIAALAEKNGYPVNIARAMVDADLELYEVDTENGLVVLTEDEISALIAGGTDVKKGRIVSRKGKLLTLTANESERYGVSSGTVDGMEELREAIGVESWEVSEFFLTPADRAVSVVTGPAVTGILVLIGLLALFFEITTPGFGVPGTVAIVCFGIVFAAYALLGTVGSMELLLFVVGLVLLIVEIFLIPGFGVVGIAGILLVVLSLVLSMQGFVWPRYEWEWGVFRRNILVVMAGSVGSIAAFAVLASVVPRVKLFSRLTLKTEQTPELGYTVKEPGPATLLPGKRGIAVTTLRPSGKAEFDGEVLPVETDGEYLSAGDPVEIIEVSGNRILVKRGL
ncbi:MAG: nodulation protein NfeD [Spirochaetes bacterium]|nr:nodulation protein NfeD [Spirochaetota bacterium]